MHRGGERVGPLGHKQNGRRALALVVLAAALSVGGVARAADDQLAIFAQGVGALKQGSYHHAVELFEALADEGYLHPDASYNRALAYIGRVKASAERPGDLGRAAAALEEVLLMRPDDHDAEAALETVRAEVARRRARNGASADVEARPSPERALVGVASETTWAILAIVSSLLLTMGLFLRGAARRAVDPEKGSAVYFAEASGSIHLA